MQYRWMVVSLLMLMASGAPRPPARPVATRRVAHAGNDYRVEVALGKRRLFVLAGTDTVLAAPIGVPMGTTLKYSGRTWRFIGPRGERTVIAKDTNPVWVPPDWHYAEVAHEHDLQLAPLSASDPVYLSDGRQLTVRHGVVGVMDIDGTFARLPTDEEIIFDSTLYIPPYGTENRKVRGELGRYRLDLGGGYLLHGTAEDSTVGQASTHGCIRLHDEDVQWLYEHIPLGTVVEFTD
jgi:hypothetical protein